jgi:hypothetical protein
MTEKSSMGIRVKTVRCDNAKGKMAPLKDMCWANGVLVEYVAPYIPQQNGKVERQFPTDLKRAKAMLDLLLLFVVVSSRYFNAYSVCRRPINIYEISVGSFQS